MKPLLSVVIPTYNNAKTLPFVLISAKQYLEHRKIPYEIIVVDYGSNDTTREIIQRFRVIMGGIKSPKLMSGVTHYEAISNGLTISHGLWRAILSPTNFARLDEFEKVLPHLNSGYDMAIGRTIGLNFFNRLYRLFHNLILKSSDCHLCFISDSLVTATLGQTNLTKKNWLAEFINQAKQKKLKIKPFPIYG